LIFVPKELELATLLGRWWRLVNEHSKKRCTYLCSDDLTSAFGVLLRSVKLDPVRGMNALGSVDNALGSFPTTLSALLHGSWRQDNRAVGASCPRMLLGNNDTRTRSQRSRLAVVRPAFPEKCEQGA